MKPELIFALDVGGTFVKAAVMENGSVIGGTVFQFDSRANEDADTILEHFVGIFTSMSTHYQTYRQATDVYSGKSIGLGFAFPGPFDYERGISYIKGLNKFESLYGVSLRAELTKRLDQAALFQTAKEVSMRFENDGRLFGLGGSTHYPDERIISLTIGTGLGSVFIERGKIIKDDERVPEGGYLYPHVFKGKTVDDQFSRRGILYLATERNLLDEKMDVKDLADLAKSGNDACKSLFVEFGSNLGEMLVPFIGKFNADRIMIGGQIAKSYDLFGPSIEQQVTHTNAIVTPLDQAMHYTFVGIDKMFED